MEDRIVLHRYQGRRRNIAGVLKRRAPELPAPIQMCDALSRNYLQNKISFPFKAKCAVSKITSPLTKGEVVAVLRMAPEDACIKDMLVLVRWQGRKLAVPLSQLTAVAPDEATQEAIGDWQHWVAYGYQL